ncbi:MAG: D-2-hydroxyacid dehydrogenase family protein [Candidatus Binatia bacterium]
MAEKRTGSFRVLVLDDYEGLAHMVPSYEKLKVRADLTVLQKRLETESELGRALKNVHAIVLVRERTRFGEREFSLAPSLELISQIGQSFAHLDLAAVTRRGVVVTGTPSDSGVSTIELTMALILAVIRRIPEVDRGMHQGGWPGIPGRILEGKTIGIVGLGRIGREVARLAQAFKTRVLASGKTLTEERARQAGVSRVSLESLLRESDVVTIHARLSQETRGLIGEKEFSLMKPGAILINTARGPVVSEAALINALETGKLGGAGLDVYDREPLPDNHPLRRFDNVVLLSHRGYGVVEVLCERYERAIVNILSFLEGKPTNLLNPEVQGR